MDSVTREKARPLSMSDLGLTVGRSSPSSSPTPLEPAPVKAIERLPETDPLLLEVRAAIAMGYSGVIFAGPPGTGKSWSAKRIAYTIAADEDAVRIIQFHASYQYEDFMEGFTPKDGGGFELQKKVFALLCVEAAERPSLTHVLLIDEISRCDVARVFGEALTYLETDKRDEEFILASGSVLTIPSNLIILATMNPWDKGVDELDVALERRFAQIDIPPSSTVLRSILEEKGADSSLIDRLIVFFEAVQNQKDEMVHIGHAYLASCTDEESTRRTWLYRLLPFFRKACRLDDDMLATIKKHWLKVIPENTAAAATAATAAEPGEPDAQA